MVHSSSEKYSIPAPSNKDMLTGPEVGGLKKQRKKKERKEEKTFGHSNKILVLF